MGALTLCPPPLQAVGSLLTEGRRIMREAFRKYALASNIFICECIRSPEFPETPIYMSLSY